VAGAYAIYDDVNEMTEEDLRRAETISLPVVAVLALLIFGSAVAASMPVLVGGLTVLGALAVVRLMALLTEVSIFSVNVITLLRRQLPGAGRPRRVRDRPVSDRGVQGRRGHPAR
jgi:RND superfamily putative drug exporter